MNAELIPLPTTSPFGVDEQLFGLFVGFLQAMIFALLVSIYLGQFLEEHDH